MNAYPIGNDLTVKWSLLYSDGSVFPLSNYDYELSYRTNRGNKVVTDTSVISVDENILTWTFKGDEQVVSGRYTICLKITLSGSKVVELQYDNAFMLSPLSGFKGAGSEIVLQSYCDAIDLKDAVLQARKAMDLAGSAVNTAGGAETTANEAKTIASTANNTSTEAKTIASNAKTVADQAKATADATAATATQKAEEVAQKEAQLEAALNNLSTDQSGALALSTKVNEHGAKLSELEEDVNKLPKEANDAENTFSICDMNGEIIAKFNNGFEVTSDGNIIIKGGFSSIVCQEKIDELNKKIDKSVCDYLSEAEDVDNIFSICDKRGDIIAKFNGSIRIESALAVEKDGVIKTENFNSSYTTSAARARFPRINFKKSPLRILDIGNSHSLCSEAYLGVILESQGVNIDDIAFCCISRGAASFKSFYQGWHDQDTSGEGDALTGGAYLVSKQFGGLDIKVSGNTYISNGDGTFTFDKKVENHSLTSDMLTCWGGDTSLIRDLMTKNQFDIILIHGQDGYLEYEESNRWRDHSDFGYMTELIRLIKTYQPSATLTYLYPLIYFNYYQKYKTLEQMDECHKIWCRSLRKYMADSGVEYVIPSGTALLNLRHSSCLSAIDSTEIEDSTSGTPIMRPFESASDFAGGVANYETRFGLHYDIPHTAFGIAGYTMSCAIYEFLFAPRFDKSILGNSLREEFKYLYFGGRNHLYLKPMKKDADGNMIPCTVHNTFSAELGWDKGRRPTIRVTDTNAKICQMAAILAVSDIWGINNPDGVTI